MALRSLATIRDDLRDQIDDPNKTTWSDTKIENAIKRVLRAAWPYFFKYIKNEDYLIGGINGPLPVNTLEISVPSEFIAASSGNERETGRITAIQARYAMLGDTYYSFTALASNDTFTATGSSYTNGTAVRLWNVSGSTLPTPLTTETTYYIVSASGSTFKLSLTSGGTAIDVTADGAGRVGPDQQNYERWFWVTQGVMVDPLNGLDPKIRFRRKNPYPYELRLWGARPITIPSVATDTIDTSDMPGFETWLLLKTEEFLRAQKQKAGEYDRRAQGQRRLLAKSDADEFRRMNRMRLIHETRFTW